ncbi:MAG TPA: hypothetical protein VFO36_02100, partial [Nitrospiraceae bacterium]|nr:hypothetical protein [Nitrospiraceae bacterium]
YYPRAAAWKLARQYFNHGAGRARTCFKHKLAPRFRQSLPALATAAAAFCLIASPFFPLALIIPAAYVLVCCAAGAAIGFHARSLCSAFAGVAAIIMHMSWGAGFLWMSARHFVRTRPWQQNLQHASVKSAVRDI